MADYVSDLDTDTGPPATAGQNPAQPQAPAQSQQPYASDLDDPNFGKQPPPAQEPAPSWSQVPMQAVSNIPSSAVQFVKDTAHPFMHPIETAEGIKNIGQGVLEKLGITEGDAHVKYADAVGQLMYDRFGSEENIRRTLANDPVGVLGDISMLLSGGETALGRLPGVASKLGKAAEATDLISTAATKAGKLVGLGRDVEPTSRELFNAANRNYHDMRSIPVEIHPWATDNAASIIESRLNNAGFRNMPHSQSGTFNIVDELRNPAGPTSTMSDIEAVRKALNEISRNSKPERAAARQAINDIDDFLASLRPSEIAAGHNHIGDLVSAAQEARGNYAAASRTKLLEDAQSKAARQAGRAGSGTNIENSTRQKYDAVLNNEKKIRGFNPEERAAVEKVVTGSNYGLRIPAKFAPSGAVSTGLSMGTGFLYGGNLGAVAVPGAGYAAKKISDAITASRANKARRLVAGRSPLGEARRANPPFGSGKQSLLPWQTVHQVGRLTTPQEDAITIRPVEDEGQSRGGAIGRAKRLAMRKH